jgi:hypothetical protein
MKAAKTNAAINATTAIAIRARKKWVMRGDAGIAISFDREKMPRQLRRPYSFGANQATVTVLSMMCR